MAKSPSDIRLEEAPGNTENLGQRSSFIGLCGYAIFCRNHTHLEVWKWSHRVIEQILLLAGYPKAPFSIFAWLG